MDLIKAVEQEYMKERPVFHIGDTVKVHFTIVEGKNERIQVYEGVVIGRQNKGIGETFTVRKNSYGVGVERVFPVYSPRIQKLEIIRRAKIRRAKLNYLRKRSGKAARLKELLVRKNKESK